MDRHVNGAVAALSRWIERPRGSQGALARVLEVSQPAVSQWIRGASRPDPHLREAIEILTGIPRADWYTDDERALVERVRVAAETGQLVDASPAPATIPPPARRASPRQRAAKARERRRAA